MMKLFFTIMLLSCWIQQAKSQNRIGLTGGGLYARSNLTNQNQSEALSQSSSTFSNIYSWYGGIVYDLKATREFSIKSKLLYMNKGWTETSDKRRFAVNTISALNIGTVTTPVEFVKLKETYTLSYLELPVNFTFYTPVGKSLLAFGVGPYISYGLSGRAEMKPLSSYKFVDSSTNIGGTTSTSVIRKSNYLKETTVAVQFSDSKNQTGYTASRFDYGASIEASIEFRAGFCLNASYTAGVVNVFKEQYGALQNRNRVLMISIGYYWKKKRKLN